MLGKNDNKGVCLGHAIILIPQCHSGFEAVNFFAYALRETGIVFVITNAAILSCFDTRRFFTFTLNKINL